MKVMQFKLIDANTKKPISTGSAKEVAKGKYLVSEVMSGKETWQSSKEAADNWDRFTAPIREKYGIPVYRPGKDGAR